MTPTRGAPRVPGGVDPWLVACLAAVVPVAVRAAAAPLCEPIAEDVDFIHHALFGAWSWFDGGGSTSFWRPIAHQVYYGVFGRLILAAPLLVAAVHVACLALGAVLLYRTFRKTLGPAEAAFVATTPLFSESTRVFVTWPTAFVNLGAWLFMAIALWAWSERRVAIALVALAAALHTKEVALVAVVLLPFAPTAQPVSRGARVRFALAALAVATAWGAAYVWVRAATGMALPHGMGERARAAGADVVARGAWALDHALRSLLNLPATHAPYDGVVLGAVLVTVLAAAWIYARDPAARARLHVRRSWLVWGGAWFVLASAPILGTYPFWSPMRTLPLALGFALALVAFVGSARRELLLGVVAVRLVTFTLAPGAPTAIASAAPATGAWEDFPRVARLQRLARETRLALRERVPALAPGEVVGWYYLPRDAEYIFGGDRWLQIHYGDPTVRFVSLPALLRDPRGRVAAFVGFEPPRAGEATRARDQIVVLPATAMRAYLIGRQAIDDGRTLEGLIALGEAERALGDARADVFRASIDGARALGLLALGRAVESHAAAERSLARWDACVDARVALLEGALADGQTAQAIGDLDGLRAVGADTAVIGEMAERIRHAPSGTSP